MSLKTTTLFIFLLSLRSILTAQVDLQWLKGQGSGPYDHCSGIVYAEDHIYKCGYFSGFLNGLVPAGATDALLSRYDKNGTLIWQRSIGGTNEDRAKAICYSKLNNQIIISGYFMGVMRFGTDSLVSNGSEDIFVAAIDSSGNWLWAKNFGGSAAESASAIYADNAGKISLAGYFEDTLRAGNIAIVSNGSRDAFLLQLDENGNCLWAKGMGGTESEEGLSISGDAHDNIYLSGYYRDSAVFGPYNTVSVSDYDCFLTSFDALGNWRWFRSFGGSFTDNCTALTYMPKSANIAAGGWYFGNISFGADTTLNARGEEESFLSAFDTLGNLLWAKSIGNELSELIYTLDSDENDNLLAVGNFDSIIIIGNDTLISKHYNRPADVFAMGFDAQGKYRWGYRSGAEFSDFAYSAVWGDSSTFYIGGNFLYKTIFEQDTLYSLGNFDTYLAKFYLDTMNIRPNAVDNEETDMLDNILVYPNPAKDYIIIENIGKNGPLDLFVYDYTGRVIKFLNTNESFFKFDITQFNENMYFVQIKFNGYSKIFKIMSY